MTHPHPATASIRVSALRPAAVLLLSIAAACADLPRDPNGTLARVRGGTMRVGVFENRPWTVFARGGSAGGIEGALVAELARELGARVEWVRATESQLLAALELHEVDLVIGGLTDDSPWAQRVALTKPFYTDTLVVAAPAGSSPPSSLERQPVFYNAREPATAGYIRKKGGVPRPVPEVGHVVGLIAAPTWQLGSFGYAPTGITLHEARHVIAATPGENAWLMRIERSIGVRKPAIPVILRTSRP